MMSFMADRSFSPPPEVIVQASFAAVTTAFASLGRVCLALDARFQVRHVSPLLDALLGEGAADRTRGQPVEALLGADLFGAGAEMRAALARGERREGWRGRLGLDAGETRLVSVTAAPLVPDASGACDPAARYLVVLRPAEEDPAAATGPGSFGGMVARSPAMARIFKLVENLAHSEATVLLTGESGTGKEMVARAIHAHSPRRDGPFVAVNCAALPGELLESELFGHVRGSFTGAVKDRVGRFEAASGGTLFLDEVAEIPVQLQAKLLRVLQERTFERLGDSAPRRTDARIVAATNVDLKRAVAEGRFRDDLFYRLRVVPIELPPLRARREDVELLARHLLARVGARYGREVRFSPQALRAILEHPWPGNVRELENALEYAVAVCTGQTLLPEDLPAELAANGPGSPRTESDARPATPRAPEERRGLDAEAERLRAVLDAHRWSRSRAAKALGVSRTTLWRKMRELGLHR